ncbi:MAG: hypothetical protein K5666_05115 [Bacilli bacterium]|nr:hypothetical protein [Bacilli bacterium]
MEMMTLNQARIELKNLTNSIEDYMNFKYIDDGYWGMRFNFEIVSIHMVRELWPELDFTVESEDTITLDELRRLEERGCNRHEDDDDYDKHAHQDRIKQEDILEADRIEEEKRAKLQMYEEHYPIIEGNIRRFFPDLMYEYRILVEYAVRQVRVEYEVSNNEPEKETGIQRVRKNKSNNSNK